MDRGPTSGRGRAWWTALGVVVALVLIGGSLVALNRSLLSVNGWLSGSQPGATQQTLPPEPSVTIGTRSSAGGGAAAPAGPSLIGGALVPVLPTVDRGGGVSGTGTTGGTTGGATGGTVGTGGTGAPGAAGGLVVGPPTAGAPSTGTQQPAVPRQPDTDGDGIPDATERAVGTSPTTADTDGDGMPDGFEQQNGLNPLDRTDGATDSDGDGLRNSAEFALRDNPREADSNNDGVADGADDLDGDGLSNA